MGKVQLHVSTHNLGVLCNNAFIKRTMGKHLVGTVDAIWWLKCSDWENVNKTASMCFSYNNIFVCHIPTYSKCVCLP